MEVLSSSEDEEEEAEVEEEEEEFPSWQFGGEADEWAFKTSSPGQWDAETSGGDMDFGSWRRNPQYSMDVKGEGSVKITLRQSHPTPKEDESRSIGFWVLRREGLAGCDNMRFVSYHSSNFVASSQFSSVTAATVEIHLSKSPLPLVVIPMSHTPGHQSRFVLTVESNIKVELGTLNEEHTQWKETLLQGRWSSSKDIKSMFRGADQEGCVILPKDFTAGGCRHHMTWRHNPQYKLRLFEPTTLIVSMTQLEKPRLAGFYLARKNTGLHDRKLTLSKEDLMGKTLFLRDKEQSIELTLVPGEFGYRLIPCTYKATTTGSFELSVWSNKKVQSL
jgi:hypothetical protein